ncbi:MAG TPA: tail fiber domain-containing protein, partial [Chthonomonadaceae bacterium]|nr:tail fiber domain-containing protein [Chthonomonadaceae bacterium]
NAANGAVALYYNFSGDDNTANGYGALYYNATGSDNTAEGYQALYNSIGNNNTAVGGQALYNTTGNYNNALGFQALSNSTGDYNIGVGYLAGQYLTTGSHNIEIGNWGASSDSGVIRIGTQGIHQAVYLAGVSGTNVGNAVQVYINSNGQLGTLTSSARFKFDIHSLGSVTDKLMDLRPVSFRYKEAAEDGSHPIQYGLIAEEVAKVYPQMVQYDKQGKPFTVFYQQLTPMMLNELQKAHQHAETQDSELSALKATMQQQSAELASLRAALEQKQSGDSISSRQGQRSLPMGVPAMAMLSCVVGTFLLAAKMRQTR